MKKLLVIFFLFLTPFLAYSQKTEKEAVGGFLHGKGWMCMIEAPEGWILDNQSWVERGIHALFYPKNTSISDESKLPPIIYFNSAYLENASDEGLKTYVDEDVKLLEEGGNVILKERKIAIKNFEKYYCYDLEYKNNGQLETVVYLRYADGVHLVILTTSADTKHEDYIPQLIMAVEKMNFMAQKQNEIKEESDL